MDSTRRAEGNLRRFFLPGELPERGEVEILGELAHRLGKVLRLKPGDQVFLLDGKGWQGRAELIQLEKERILARVLERTPASGEPSIPIVLYQALIRPQRFEQALEKGTELGVAGFVPIRTERSTVKDIGEERRNRLQRIIREAAEQSHRRRLPPLGGVLDFASACQRTRSERGFSLLFWEEEGLSLRQALAQADSLPRGVNIFIGPEGGFSAGEVELARGYGLIPTTLGQRPLRSETAALAAVALILYELGELE